MTSANTPGPGQGQDPAPPGRSAPEPEAPEQSAEDTDAGWGEVPGHSDDERFYRDRPPHWGSD